MPKRKPIDYTPQFGGGIFRPKDEVESERLVADTSSLAQKGPSVRPFDRTDERTVLSALKKKCPLRGVRFLPHLSDEKCLHQTGAYSQWACA